MLIIVLFVFGNGRNNSLYSNRKELVERENLMMQERKGYLEPCSWVGKKGWIVVTSGGIGFE